MISLVCFVLFYFFIEEISHVAVFAQSVSHVPLFVTSWTAACQAPLFFTVSWNLFRFMSIESVMLSSHLAHPLPPASLFAFKYFPALGAPVSQLFTSDGQSIGHQMASASVLPMSIQG